MQLYTKFKGHPTHIMALQTIRLQQNYSTIDLVFSERNSHQLIQFTLSLIPHDAQTDALIQRTKLPSTMHKQQQQLKKEKEKRKN